jgi:pimeloyl-ACP methyl ester carboxylesterase
VTFDRRGEGASTGKPSRGRFQLQATDALAILDALDVERVGLWGISQGAWVGPIAALRSSRGQYCARNSLDGYSAKERPPCPQHE